MRRAAGAHAGVAMVVGGAAIGISLMCRIPAVSHADEASVTPTFRSSRVGRHDPLAAKLEQIVENDQRILQQFDGIMEEMKIVKIRVLRRPQTPPTP